ncbi:MAG: hypothetical protein R3A52_23630 [Polyangiales bacterium]
MLAAWISPLTMVAARVKVDCTPSPSRSPLAVAAKLVALAGEEY